MDLMGVWQQIQQCGELSEQKFGKPTVCLDAETFVLFQHNFTSQFALFSPYENYRAGGWWRHLHAVKHNDLVYVHIDHCNPNVNFWLNVPHGVIDVVPYLLWCLWQRRTPFRID